MRKCGDRQQQHPAFQENQRMGAKHLDVLKHRLRGVYGWGGFIGDCTVISTFDYS
jgi:hypothetical protein